MSTIKERPILFNGEMVRAILDGRKTQTRRPIKGLAAKWLEGGFAPEYVAMPENGLSPFGYPGDRLVPAITIPSLGRNYAADTLGRIWSRARDGRTWRVLKGAPSSKGYLTVTPSVDKKYRTRLVHHLICEAFYGLRPYGMSQVRHLDGCRTNNAPDNLDWATAEQNWVDRKIHGRGMAERHHAARLTMDDVVSIRASAYSHRALAAHYGVSKATIGAILTGKTWADSHVVAYPNFPRWTRPITLKVTAVRVERVQDISEADARAEGIIDGGCLNCGNSEPCGCQNPSPSAVDAFCNLWHSIYGNWHANPWVWVTEFKVVEVKA